MNLSEKNLEIEGKLRQDILDLLIKYNKETGILVQNIYLDCNKVSGLGVEINMGIYTKLDFNSFSGLLPENQEENK